MCYATRRWVAKGYSQRPGVDFFETDTTTIKYSTLRLMLAAAAEEDLEVHVIDYDSAFLNGELGETVYVEQPEGYSTGGHEVCLMHKAIYGLKQAPRTWQKCQQAAFQQLGLQPCAADPNLYYAEIVHGRVYVPVYVDDNMVVCPVGVLAATKEALLSLFPGKDLGPIKQYVGWQVQRNRPKRQLFVSQTRYAQELVARFGLADATAAATPLPTSKPLPERAERADPAVEKLYRSAVGGAGHLANCTRGDIAHALSVLARYMACPRQEHLDLAMHLLRYIKGTAHYGITYGRNTDGALGYCDADWGSEDTDARRSTSGVALLYNGGAISWQSRLQRTVAVSTMEAEYQAAALAVREALHLRQLLVVMGKCPQGPLAMRTDSTSALALLTSSSVSQRSKHIDVQHHFARDRVLAGDVVFTFCPSKQMVADALTKRVSREVFEFCCSNMGIGPPAWTTEEC